MSGLGGCTLVCGSYPQNAPQQLGVFIQRARELDSSLALASTWINCSVLDNARLHTLDILDSLDVCEAVLGLLQECLQLLAKFQRRSASKTFLLIRLVAT
jgi:hypothetical protein